MKIDTPRVLIVSFWLLLASFGFLYVSEKLVVVSDISMFMPPPSNEQEALLSSQLRDGSAQRVLMVGLHGGDSQSMARTNREMAESLRLNALFSRVANGELPNELPLSDPIFVYRYLFDSALDATNSLDAEHMRRALAERLSELVSPLSSAYKPLLQSDPTGAFRRVAAPLLETQLHKRHGVWFSESGARSLMLLQMQDGGFDVAAASGAVSAVRAAFASANRDATTVVELSGPGVFALSARDATRADAKRLSVISSIALSVLVLVVYRSPRIWLLSVLPVLCGMLAGTVALTLGFASVHAIALAFGGTLLGVAIDYPLHIFSHAHRRQSVHTTVRVIWPTLRLGAITSVFGFLALCTTRFSGLAQLGLFAACGLLAAAAASRWLLPSLIGNDWRPTHDFHEISWLERFAIPRKIAWVLALGLLAASVGVLSIARDGVWERSLAALSPVAESQLKLDVTLRRALQAPDPRHLLLVHDSDQEKVLVRLEKLAEPLAKLRDQGAFADFDMAARYLPSKATQLARREALPPRDVLAKRVTAAMQELPFKEGAFAPFLQAVEESKVLPALSPDDLAASLLAPFVTPLLRNSPNGAIGIVTLANVHDLDAIKRWVDGSELGGVSFIDLKQVSNDAVNSFRSAALERLLLAAIIVMIVLGVTLRDARRVLAVALALFSAALCVAATLYLLGERLSLFHLMALLLVFGIGIDYGLFFTWRDGPLETRRRTLHALSVCALSSTTVFAILAWSELPVLRAIGLTVALGVVAAYLFSALYARALQPPERATAV